MTFRETVNPVVVGEYRDVGVSPYRVDHVIAALGIHIPVSSHVEHDEAGICCLGSGGVGDGAPMEPVKEVGVHVVVEFGSLAYP